MQPNEENLQQSLVAIIFSKRRALSLSVTLKVSLVKLRRNKFVIRIPLLRTLLLYLPNNAKYLELISKTAASLSKNSKWRINCYYKEHATTEDGRYKKCQFYLLPFRCFFIALL